MMTTHRCSLTKMEEPRGLPVVKLSAENHQFPSTKRQQMSGCYSSMGFYSVITLVICSYVCVVPCVLVTGRKLSMCVDGLLQLFLFGPSAVAKLWKEKKKKVNVPFFLKCYLTHVTPKR